MVTINDVYCKFGEVSEAAQLLETEIGTALLSLRAVENNLLSGDKPTQAKEILEKINRSTLGTVLKQIEKSSVLPEHLDQLLADALLQRNRLAHCFYREHNIRRYTAEGCEKMIEDLESIHETIFAAYKALLMPIRDRHWCNNFR